MPLISPNFDVKAIIFPSLARSLFPKLLEKALYKNKTYFDQDFQLFFLATLILGCSILFFPVVSVLEDGHLVQRHHKYVITCDHKCKNGCWASKLYIK